ncbi:MAG: hypothetical protein JWM00_159 [Candidatus Saccharibacteria bacterium]|nr:hypothetical protein [Candidatus Saccharibacteria bacterium]
MGKALVNHFYTMGWNIVTLTRNGHHTDLSHDITDIPYDLGNDINAKLLERVDYLIHAAYAKDNLALNVAAAERLLDAARAAQVKQVLFISSMSAHNNATSIYGRQKYAIEKMFLESGRLCIRPGLIAGNGGIFRNILSTAGRFHIIPIISGGNQPVQLIKLDDLVSAIGEIIISDKSRIITVAHPTQITYKKLFKIVFERAKIQVLFLHLPYWLAYVIFWVIGQGLPSIGISHDNLAGLKNLQSSDTTKEMTELGLNLPPIEDYIATIKLG